jgi:hypothetical protein
VDSLARCFAILGAVHHKVLYGTTLTVKAEVVHEGIAEKLGVAGSAGQVAGGDDKVGIAVVNLNRDAG